jgi:hypothetical protein
MVQIKAGWKTSEFWMTLLTNVIGMLGMAKGIVPSQDVPYVVMALTVLNSVYTIARTFIKQAAPMTTTTTGPATTTITTTKP